MTSSVGLFLFTNGTIPPSSEKMGNIYNKYAKKTFFIEEFYFKNLKFAMKNILNYKIFIDLNIFPSKF